MNRYDSCFVVYLRLSHNQPTYQAIVVVDIYYQIFLLLLIVSIDFLHSTGSGFKSTRQIHSNSNGNRQFSQLYIYFSHLFSLACSAYSILHTEGNGSISFFVPVCHLVELACIQKASNRLSIPGGRFLYAERVDENRQIILLMKYSQ